MITAITYNCTPDSLADVAPEDFADAFENAVRARERFRDLGITVTFEPAVRSEVTVFASDDWEADITHEDEYRETFAALAREAFEHCCS
jgi:hypothetical protein